MRPLYSFSAGSSLFHSLDPRTKLVFSVSVLLATFFAPHPWFFFLGMILFIWLAAHINPKDYYQIFFYFIPIMLMMVFMHTAFINGPPYYAVWHMGPVFIGLSQPGLATGLTIAFRLATMGTAFMMFSMTTEPYHWGLAMHKAGIPYKVAYMFATAMRFFPLLQEEFLTIQSALKARGSAILTSYNPVTFFRGIVTVVIPLVLASVRRSQAIALAMELRGLSLPEQTGVPRVIYREVSLKLRDYLVMFLSVGGLLGLIAYAKLY